MSKKIRAFIGYLKVLVNGETLGGGFYRFLSVHACFLVFYGLPHVFINTMLLGQTGDVKVVVMYNATFFLGSAAAMLLAAGLLQRTDSGVTAVLGILGYNVLYLLLIVLGDNASRWHLWLGLLAGLADGCYWLSYGHLLSDSTDLSNRDSGLAIVNICANVVNLTIPLLAGFIIDAVGGTRGYMAVFGLSFAVSAVTCALALRLPKRRMAGAHKVDYPRTLRAIGRNRHLLYSLAAQGCKGVREGAFTFILSIVLYQMVKNELLVGFNTFLSAAGGHRFLRHRQPHPFTGEPGAVYGYRGSGAHRHCRTLHLASQPDDGYSIYSGQFVFCGLSGEFHIQHFSGYDAAGARDGRPPARAAGCQRYRSGAWALCGAFHHHRYERICGRGCGRAGVEPACADAHPGGHGAAVPRGHALREAGRAGGLNAGVFPHKQKYICQKRKSRWPQSTFRC